MKVTLKGAQATLKALKKHVEKVATDEKKLVSNQLVAALKDATPVDTGEARDGWKTSPEGVTNDVEHIRYLNEGSSEQAPAHFIEKTVLANPRVKPSGVIVRIS